MSFKQFLAILRARWIIAASIFVLIAGGTLLISILMPKTYSATSTVVIDVKPDPLGGLAAATGITPTMIETQVDIIQSDRVAARVVKNLKLAENADIRSQWMSSTRGEGNFELWLSETFQRNLDVRPSRASGVLSITYRSPDPKFAAALANAFAKAYLEVSLELRVDPAKQYSTFFDVRAKEARDTVERAQAKATAFQRENSIIAADERFDIETARLNELSTQMVMLQSQSSESGIRQTQAQGSGGERMQEVLNNPLISGLKADLNRAEARLQELSARYGDNHPQMQEARANIAELRAKVDSETKRVVGGVGLSNTINRQREGELRAALDAQRSKVLKLKAIRDEGLVLLREADNAQRMYDQVVARLNQTSLESQTNQSNIALLSEARTPNQASSPRVMLNTALAAVLGLIVALVAAMGREAVDRRLRLPSDVVDALGLPILGNIPGPSKRGLLGGTSTSEMQQRLLASSSSGRREN